jgi:TolB protein
MASDGSDVRQVTTDPADKWRPAWPFNGTHLAWSPDGTRLIYVAEGGVGAGADLWLLDLVAGGEPRNLTSFAGHDYQPAWCADGSIWFTSARINGIPQIFTTTLDNVAAGTPPTNFSATHNFPREYDPALLPGCQHLVFVSSLNGAAEIWRWLGDCPDCYTMLFTDQSRGGTLDEPAVSPDGARVVYTEHRAADNLILAGLGEGAPPGTAITASGTDSQAAWSADGHWLAFVTERDGNPDIYRMTPGGEDAVNLTTSPAADLSPAWQPAPASAAQPAGTAP